jgi:hypothetical protein
VETAYFYSEDAESGKMVKLLLTKPEQSTFEKLIAGKFDHLSEDKYWHSYVRFPMTHAPKGYLVWENKTYWLTLLPKVGDDHQYIDGTHGVHVIEITKNKMRHRWHKIDANDQEPDENDDPYGLVYVAWDWVLDGEGKNQQKTMSDNECKVVKDNIAWTGSLHERLQKKYPRDDEDENEDEEE